MLQLDGRALTFGCVGAVIGAAIVGAAWVIVSTQHEPEPAFRHTRLYDKCLAAGHSIMACDADVRVLKAMIEDYKARRIPLDDSAANAPVAEASTVFELWTECREKVRKAAELTRTVNLPDVDDLLPECVEREHAARLNAPAPSRSAP